MEEFNQPFRILGEPEFQCRIGISTGVVVLAIISIMVTIPERKREGTTVTQDQVATNDPAASAQ